MITHLYTQYLVSILPAATAALTIYLTGPQPTFLKMPKKRKLPVFVRYSSEILEKGENTGPRAEGERIEMERKLYG